MTISQDTAGNDRGLYNLRQENYQEFADYITEVANHFASDWDIRFSVLAPFNEPLHRWWYRGNSQEGNEWNLDQLLPFLQMLR